MIRCVKLAENRLPYPPLSHSIDKLITLWMQLSLSTLLICNLLGWDCENTTSRILKAAHVITKQNISFLVLSLPLSGMVLCSSPAPGSPPRTSLKWIGTTCRVCCAFAIWTAIARRSPPWICPFRRRRRRVTRWCSPIGIAVSPPRIGRNMYGSP